MIKYSKIYNFMPYKWTSLKNQLHIKYILQWTHMYHSHKMAYKIISRVLFWNLTQIVDRSIGFGIFLILYFNLQMNKHAKHADTLKTKSGDLKNNIFTAKITLDNLRRDIGGMYLI